MENKRLLNTERGEINLGIVKRKDNNRVHA